MVSINKKTESDLRKELTEKRSLVQQFRFGMTGSKTRNVKKGRDLHRDIARILTELNRRNLKISNE